MQHFILPKEAKHIPVPYVCSEEYNGVPFEDYPKSKGWSEKQLLGDPDFGSKTPEEVEAFFQNWLYFGFLSNLFSILGIRLRQTDFVRKNTKGELFVTTKKLLRVLSSWLNWQNPPPGKEGLRYEERLGEKWRPPKKRAKQISTLFAQVFPWVNRYCNENRERVSPSFAKGERHWPMSDEICMSIIALGQTLADYAYHSVDSACEWEIIRLGSWGSSHLLTQRMQQAGWCIGDISLVHDGGNVACTYYFGAVPGPRKGYDHSTCTRISCRAGSIAVGKYKQAHICKDSNCQDIVARGIEEVIKIGIDNVDGVVPLVCWKKSRKTKKYELEIRKGTAENKTPYVAISHVWSDGLGNETKNSLPVCQLQRMQKMVDELYKFHPNPRTDTKQSIPFWMDTLCCPVEDKYIDLRHDTIRKMANIYRRADRVLVLDAGIQVCSRSASFIEKTATVYISNWLRRLWTLQEGVLANAVYFQFKDGPDFVGEYDQQFQDSKFAESLVLGLTYRASTTFLTLNDPVFENQSEIYEQDDSSASSWETEVSDFSNQSRSANASQENEHNSSDADGDAREDDTTGGSDEDPEGSSNSVNMIINTLSVQEQLLRRFTSRPLDETICVATLFDIDPVVLFPEKSHEKRMEILLQKMKLFSQLIVFNTFPRLQTEGFRWAPRSYLGLSCRLCPDDYNPGTAYISPRGGLQVRFPAITLGHAEFPLKDKFIASVGDRKYKIWKPEDEDQWPSSWENTLDYVLISHEGYRDIKRDAFYDMKVPFEDGVDAILGVLQGEDEVDRPRIMHICRALLWPGLEQFRNDSLQQEELQDALPEVLGCERLKPRKWCII